MSTSARTTNWPAGFCGFAPLGDRPIKESEPSERENADDESARRPISRHPGELTPTRGQYVHRLPRLIYSPEREEGQNADATKTPKASGRATSRVEPAIQPCLIEPPEDP